MPALDTATCRRLVAAARVARLATVGVDGRPHLVPVCFAVVGDDIASAVDAKPKRAPRLRRLDNAAAHPAVALLVDHYDDADWTSLWWVRVDAIAVVRDEDADARRALAGKYAQYRDQPPLGPVLRMHPVRWTGWAYSRSE